MAELPAGKVVVYIRGAKPEPGRNAFGDGDEFRSVRFARGRITKRQDINPRSYLPGKGVLVPPVPPVPDVPLVPDVPEVPEVPGVPLVPVDPE